MNDMLIRCHVCECPLYPGETVICRPCHALLHPYGTCEYPCPRLSQLLGELSKATYDDIQERKERRNYVHIVD